MRLPMTVIGVLLAVLLAIGFASERGSEPGAASATADPARVATIARRVEALRGLRFERDPRPVTVTPEQATREGLADLDRAYPPAARAADETLYEALGLLPEGTDLRKVSASIFGEQVAGYYDPRTGRLRIVEGVATNRVVDEMIIAHELTHALEDQAVGLDLGTAERSDDAGYAYKALVEGTASALMFAYVERHFGSEEALGGIFSSALTQPSTADLPPFVLAGMLFPYLEGQAFVDDLYGRTDSWELVDVALRERPPASTEQVLHPDRWMAADEPEDVALPDPGPDWRQRTTGTFGEWQTGQLLALAGGDWPAAAAGWEGDRYALHAGDAGDLVVIRWRYESAREAGALAAALRTYAETEIPDGTSAAVAASGRGVTLVLAPDRATARRIAAAPSRA